MRRREVVNVMLACLAAASVGALYVTRHRPSSVEQAARQDKLLPRFRKDDVKRLQLTREGQTLELVREASGDFRIVRPWAERADTATVNQLLASLELASFLRPLAAPAPSGTSANALRIQVDMASESLGILLGSPNPSPPGARNAELTGDGHTTSVVVSQGVSNELDVPFSKFRETRLLEYGRRELKKVTLSSRLGKLELEQREHGAFFFSEQGHTELVEPAALERVVTALSRVSTEQFVEPEQARSTLATDPLTVTIESNVAGAAPLTLTFAAGCQQAPGMATVLREEGGKQPRAGCIASDVPSALRVSADDLRLNGPFATTLDAVEELSLRVGSAKLELARKDKAWLLRTAGNREVALEAGDRRISALLAVRGQRAEGDAKTLGLEPAAGEAVIQVTGSDEASHREEQILLGQVRADGSRCFQRKLDSVRLCFDKSASAAFDTDASLLRGSEVLRFAPSELTQLSIDTKDLHERLVRSAEGQYQLEEPKGFRHDGSLVADAVQSLGTLQAVRWVAPPPAGEEAKLGFVAPRARITFQLGSAASRELLVGATTEGGAFARLSGDPAVFVLGALPLADLETPLVDRALCPFDRAQLARIELKRGERSVTLTRADDAWSAAPLTPAQASDLADTLIALRAEQALHIGAARANEGFDQPRATITFVDAAGKRARLSLGARSTLGEEPVFLARLEGIDATFALLARVAEPLLSL
jgi:hypothetical protein